MWKELGKTFLSQLKKTLRYKYFWFIIFVIVIILSFIRTNFIIKSNYSGKEKEFELVVLNKKFQNDKYTVTLKEKEKIIITTTSFPYDVGDIIYVKGDLEKVNNNTIPNLFNYQKYLRSRGIFWQLKIKEARLIKNNSNLWNKLKNNIINHVEKIKHCEYIYAFLLGDTSHFSKEIRNKYQLCGLSYILSIGSIEVMLIIKLLKKIEEKFKVSRVGKLIINSLIIVFYIFFTNYIIGVLRSGLCYILKDILNYKKIEFNYYNIILLVGIFLLIFDPFYITNVGYLYSFSISLAICIFKKKIKGNYFRRLLIISFMAFTIGLPITMFNNYEINYLAILFSFILAPIFHLLVFPLCIIVLIFPFLINIFNFIINFIENIVNFFSQINLFVFIFRRPSMILIVIYYLVIILFFYKPKYLLLLIILFLFHYNINKIVKEDIITFLDVKEGDAIIFKTNNELSLIDTGGNNYYEFTDEIIKYIKSLGISKINTLILTHGDLDHMGEAINLVSKFKVEKVIFNCGELNNLEQELIKVLNKKKISYYLCVKELKIDNKKLYFLQTKEYDNENDNSNVIYTKIDGYSFMFMADASKRREIEILNKYYIANVDVLKVGHHGSKTSSSKDFVNKINPKYGIISVGKNFYGHPNKEVLENLKDSKIYRTDQDGSITFKIKNNNLDINTCPP